MRAIHAFIAAGVSAAACLLAPPATAQCPSGRFEIVLHEQFNGSSLDASHWTAVESAFHGNNEQQYYHPSAVSVTGGKMVITSTNQPSHGWPYTSGLVNTRGKLAQLFGRWEIRAKMPRTQGIWPAIWLLPDTGAWPPEIDIMELLGHEPTKMYMSNHWGVWPQHAWKTSSFTGPDFSAGFHTFACEWYPGRIDFFVDGVMKARHTDAVPQVPMYLIMNTAVGGNWGGYPDGTTVFPQTLEVDWVKVYRLMQPEQLVANAGFESALTSWSKWGNAFSSNFAPRTGTLSGKMFGNFTGAPNTTALHQTIAATPGENYSAQVWWLNDSRDRMQGSNYADTRIEFLNSAGTALSTSSKRSLDANSPADAYRWVEVEGVAPQGTVQAKLVLQFNQFNNQAGAAFMDDVLFGPVDCPKGTGLHKAQPRP